MLNIIYLKHFVMCIYGNIEALLLRHSHQNMEKKLENFRSHAVITLMHNNHKFVHINNE